MSEAHVSGTPRNRIKVVVAKPGLDGHDRGAKVIARALRDAGMEVIYTGIFQSPESIVLTVLQEDAQVLGISSLAGAHLEYTTEIIRRLREEGMGDVLVLVGGTIPTADAATLREAGVGGVFGPGTPTAQVVAFIEEHAPRIEDRVSRPWTT
ncbi:MAG TPA: cobalamin B12-binding domain-containing protein [Candidatus Limnocylindrales bacterium]|nr:cobalamin B12-binding domain-containing protein [Candidatus Limnocylindrales bacterium]